MSELQAIRRARFVLIKSIKTVSEPHLYKSGYCDESEIGDRLMVAKIKKVKLSEGNVELIGRDWVSLDAYAGGLATMQFTELPIDDLAALSVHLSNKESFR